ncbi:SCO1860 family LAETG-anchored protein [Streptomyces sp. NPDC059866]|uniref:SCO1860 family LAETG-anchored protein n=1 Tax=Streptomyces sp. NPDC059866 TaxID=3346978 RepID=UPI0036660365
MNSFNFRRPARSSAAVAAAAVLAAGPAALAGAGSAHATGDEGRASAVVLRTGLDVSLLNKTVNVPLAVSLNEVQAPQSAEKTALTAQLDGVDGGNPFTVLRADVAQAKATVTAEKAEGSTRLANAQLHVPGLPLLSLIEVEGITSTATCAAGEAPVADSNVLGAVTVLGKRVKLTAGGPTDVTVPGVGEVRLDLSQRETTSRTAAATALELKVSVNPLKLNVAEVEGTLTLAKATCEAPAAPAEQAASPSADPVGGVKPQGAPAESGLAETGGSSMTPYIAGGAVALLAAGGGAVALARRKRS